jgi:hypothetical protein
VSDDRRLESLRALVAELDRDLVVAADEVDRSLIALALERSPLARVDFSSQLLAALSRFRRVDPSDRG